MNDAAGQVVEQATYCAPNDKKRPQRVGLPDFTARDICPADLSKGVDELTDAYPDGWYVRVMFDELLDPSIEELTEIKDPDTGEGTDTYSGSIANTHPVKLECESIGGGFVEVDYDGYYSPAGNAVTWPLGPSLVIKPNEPKSVATNKECKVTLLDNILDKSGEKVPAAQREFKFKIAPITVISLDPADDPDGASPIDPFDIYTNGNNVNVTFNTAVDPASFCDDGPLMDQCEWQFAPQVGECTTPRANGSLIACDPSKSATSAPFANPACTTAGDTCDYQGDDFTPLLPFGGTEADFAFFTNAAIEGGKKYAFSFKQGAKVKDRCGVETTFGAPSADDLTLTNYKTNTFDFSSATPGTGDLVSAMKKPDLVFNNVIDPTSLAASEYSLTPAPDTATLETNTDGDIFFAGNYLLNTEYTLTINAGAKINDYYGAEYTFPEAKVIKYKTQPAVTVSTSPADLGTITKSSMAATASVVTLTFNQKMDLASLTQGTDYTLVDANNANVATATVQFGAAPNDCTEVSTGCQLRLRGNVAPGKYTFTLKAGAALTGFGGATFTQAADKIIHFTVKVADPVTPIQCL